MKDNFGSECTSLVEISTAELPKRACELRVNEIKFATENASN